MEENDHHENTGLSSPVAGQDDQTATDGPLQSLQTGHYSDNSQTSTDLRHSPGNIQPIPVQNEFDGQQQLTNQQIQQEIAQNDQHLSEQTCFSNEYQQINMGRQPISMQQPHGDMQPKPTTQEVPYDFQTKTIIKLEPGISSAADNMGTSEWGNYSSTGNGAETEFTTMQPYPYYRSAFDPSVSGIDHINNFPNQNKNMSMLDPMLSRLNDGDELHPFDTSGVQVSTDNMHQIKSSMYNYGDFPKSTVTNINVGPTNGNQMNAYPNYPPPGSMQNRDQNFNSTDTMTRQRSCEDMEDPRSQKDEKVIVPEGRHI